MYISQEELNKRLTHTEIRVNKREEVRGTIGSKKAIPVEIRKAAAVFANEGSQDEVADLLGISQTAVSRSVNGMNNAGDIIDEVVEASDKAKEDKSKSRDTIRERALDALSSAVDQIGNKIATEPVKLTELSKVALDLNTIAGRSSGNEGQGGNRVLVNINVPPMKEERHYETVTV